MAFTSHTHEHRVRVRYAETDAAGIAHHSSYLLWLEAARVEWLRALGADYAAIERDGYHLAVVEARLRYVAPAVFDQPLVIRTGVADRRSREITFVYEVVSQERRARQLANASSRHVWLRDGRIVRAPAYLEDLLT